MSRTQVARDYISAALFATERPAPATVIALSDTTVPVPEPGFNTHTVLGGEPGNEHTEDGLGRGLAAYAHTAGTQVATLQRTFVHSAPSGAGTPRTVRVVGVFAPVTEGDPGPADSGTLIFEMAEPNPPVLTGTDSVSQVVSIDFGA